MIRTMSRSIFAIGMILILGAPTFAQTDAAATIGALKDYQPQMGRTKLLAVEEAVRKSHGDAALRTQIEQQMIALLESGATPEAKQFVCRQLWVIGTAACVPALQKMLVDETTTQVACYALKSNPAPEVNKALRDSVSKVKGPAQQAIVNLLGDRRDSEALAVLQPLVPSSDAGVAESALVAIGKIGTNESAAFLADKRKTTAEPLRTTATQAYLQCARELAAKGTTDAAVVIYEELKSNTELHLIQRGAVVGIMELGGPRAQRLVFDLLLKGDPQLKAAALANSRNIRGGEFTRQMIMFMQSLPPADQALALEALIDRNERAVLPALNAFAGHSNLQVRLTAIKGLGLQGDEACVPTLVKAMAGEEAVKQSAIMALRKLSGDKPNAALIQAVPDSAPSVRGDLIRILSDRKVAAAVPMLLAQAAGTDEMAAKLSLKALSELAGPQELPQILDIVCSKSSESARAEAELTTVVLAKKITPPADRSAAVLERMSKIQDTVPRCALLRVLGGIADPASLAVLTKALADSDVEVGKTALRILAEWPDGSAAQILLQTASTATDSTTKILALRGAIRGIGLQKDKSAAERIAAYQKVVSLSADRPEEKKRILAGLAELQEPEILSLVAGLLGDPAVAAEAEQTVLGLASRLPRDTSIVEALNKLIMTTQQEPVRLKAREILARMTGLNFESAGWIWSAAPQGDPLSQVPAGKLGFRRTISFTDTGKYRQAQMLISADDQYALTVNGKPVGQGQPWMQGGRYNLTAMLKPGDNVLAVEVTNAGPSPAGLILNLEITDDAGNKTYIVSDSRWKCSASLADGWTQPGFDDASWSWAKVYGLYGCPPWEKKIVVP
jgi:HEAT repeat protein